MDASEIKEIMNAINIALGGYVVLGIEYIEPGPGYCGSFEITVDPEEDLDKVCDDLISLCKNKNLDIDDWHSGVEGFIIPLYAYWDMFDE